MLALVNTLTPIRTYRRVTHTLSGIIVLWAIIGEFGTAFLCHLPRPWDYLGKYCSNDTIRVRRLPPFYKKVLISDSAHVVELSRMHKHHYRSCFDLLAYSYNLANTNISCKESLGLLIFCASQHVSPPPDIGSSRANFYDSVIAASICKLVFWDKAQDLQQSGHDPWTVILCTQVIQCVSIISTCFLYLKPFLDSVESGFIRSDDIRRRGTDDYYGHATGGSSAIRSAFSTKKHDRNGSQSIGLVNLPSGHHTATVTTEANPDLDTESQHSRAHIIKETRTFAVETATN